MGLVGLRLAGGRLLQGQRGMALDLGGPEPCRRRRRLCGKPGCLRAMERAPMSGIGGQGRKGCEQAAGEEQAAGG